MSGADGGGASRRRSGLVVPGVFVLAALVALIGLGNWQLERKTWKEALVDTLDRRLAAQPVDLPARARWSRLDPANDEFRRVAFAAEFIPNQEALVYTSGSAFRSDISGPGYWVLAPARFTGGSVIVVNRGFVPEGRQDRAAHAAGDPKGVISIVGVMRWPEPAGWFTPKDDPGHNLWFVRDPVAIAAAKGWGEVAPFFVEMESPQPPGGLPHAGPLKVNLRNEHLQYALTWYGLAVVLAIAFLFWVRSRRREARAGAH